MQGRTTLILAHRLSSVIGADRILVLDHGRVVESGRHAELMRRDGPYRRLMGAAGRGSAAPRRADDASETPAAAADDAARKPPRARGAISPPKRKPSAGARRSQSLLRYHRSPGMAALTVTVLCGIGRVVAFIGVGVLGALADRGASSAAAIPLWASRSPLLHRGAGGRACCTGSNRWLAHDMAYRLLAEMRIALFAQARRAGAGLSDAAALRRSGRAGDARTSRRSSISTPIPWPRLVVACWCRRRC